MFTTSMDEPLSLGCLILTHNQMQAWNQQTKWWLMVVDGGWWHLSRGKDNYNSNIFAIQELVWCFIRKNTNMGTEPAYLTVIKPLKNSYGTPWDGSHKSMSNWYPLMSIENDQGFHVSVSLFQRLAAPGHGWWCLAAPIPPLSVSMSPSSALKLGFLAQLVDDDSASWKRTSCFVT